MFTLTRPRRQVLATLAVVAVCIAPTGFVAATAWSLNRPGHVRDVEIELGRDLGLQVTLEAVRYPRPGEVVYRGLVLRQDERGRGGLHELARIRLLHVRAGTGDLALAADGVELRAESPRQAMLLLATALQRVGGAGFERIDLTAASCRTSLGEQIAPVEARDLAGTCRADVDGPSLTLSYRLPVASAGTSPTRCELTVTRRPREGRSALEATFKTMEGEPLPVASLQPFFDTDHWLGGAAKVWGTLALRQATAGEWEADFQGELVDVDLAALVGNRFPGHVLTGRSRIAIRNAHWAERPGQGFGWCSAEGDLVSGPGTIGVDLMRSLARELRLRLGTKLVKASMAPAEVAFRSLGLEFRLEPDGQIRLAGACGGEYAPDVVMVAANQITPLAHAPSGPANVRGLLKALYPAVQDLMVPATAESQAVQRYLPLPTALADRSSQRLNAH